MAAPQSVLAETILGHQLDARMDGAAAASSPAMVVDAGSTGQDPSADSMAAAVSVDAAVGGMSDGTSAVLRASFPPQPFTQAAVSSPDIVSVGPAVVASPVAGSAAATSTAQGSPVGQFSAEGHSSEDLAATAPNAPPLLGSPSATGASPSADGPEQLAPNKTLYVNNLNSKIKLEQLKQDLQGIFGNFGTVRQIVAMTSFWRRGQAWVVFADQESADKALAQLQGFPYANKEMRIQYAREVSDIFAKEEGTYVKRPPGPKKPRAIVEREKKLQTQLQQFQQMMLQHMQQQQQTGGSAQPLMVSQPLQAASAIAAQVQQVMQQPSLLAMFPNAVQLQAAQMQQQHQVQQHHPSFAHQHPMSVHSYHKQHHHMNPQSGGLPNGPGNFGHLGPGAGHHVSGGAMGTGPAGMMGGVPSARQGGPPPMIPNQQPFMGSHGAGSGMMMIPRGPPPPAGGMPDMKAVPPPAAMSKDAVVAAAAAAAAAAVGAAAKKRAAEGTNAGSPSAPPPPARPVPKMGGFGTQESQPAPFGQNPAAMAAAAAAAAAASLGGPASFYQNNASSAAHNSGSGPSVPNRTLCVEALPDDCSTKMLEMVFKQYAGCGDIRYIASRRVAFVDYETVAQSSVALRYLNNFPIKENHLIKVSYARQ